VRCRGAASLELCAVASGEADAYYESDLQIWDIAAGQLIVLESGAHLVGDAAPGGVPLIAAPKVIATALLDVLSGAGGETA
jgi:myo-inositol-1(or 4)-monophosphatase